MPVKLWGQHRLPAPAAKVKWTLDGMREVGELKTGHSDGISPSQIQCCEGVSAEAARRRDLTVMLGSMELKL